jgi:cytochrome c-type biogenesis protein CcmE
VKPKHQRLVIVVSAVLIMAGAAAFLLRQFQQNLVFFFTPTQVAEAVADGRAAPGKTLRLGGLVEAGSVESLDGGGIRFTVTDGSATLPVTYRGLLPTLFREGQGVVAIGTLENGQFTAREILAKHDENYMPKEVADALKQSGHWKQP